MAKTLARVKYLLIAIFCIIAFMFVFASLSSQSYEANAAISNTDGTVITNGEVDEYSVSAINSGASATLKAYYKDAGTGGETRIANAYVQRTITIVIDNSDIVAAAQNGRMKAKVLLTGSNQFNLISGTENISTSAIYALSGGIAQTSINLASQSSFEDLSISENFLTLTPTSGTLSITLTATAIHHAETPGSGTGESVAETSLECSLTSIKILFWFDDVKVSLTISGNGKVTEMLNGVPTQYTQSQPNLTYTFGEEISFEAASIVNTTYFRGWTVSGVQRKLLYLDLPRVHEVPYTTNLSYVATFSNFEIASNLSAFPHNAQVQGPKATETNMLEFRTEHIYSGENALSEPYAPSSLKPMDSGTYLYTFLVKFDIEGMPGDQVGSFSKAFVIEKNKPNLTPNSTTHTLILGDAVADMNFSVSAVHGVNGAPVLGSYQFIETPATEEVEGLQVITINTVAAALALDITKIQGVTSGKDLYYRFTPAANFSLNHSISWGKVTLVVEDKIENDSVNVNATTRTATITKTIVTSIDPEVLNNMSGKTIEKETVKISLRVNFNDESGRYFFIGWRFGEFLGEGEYSYGYLTAGGNVFDPEGSGFSYDYYLPEWTEGGKQARVRYSYARIQAIFIEDVSSEENTLSKNYTGAAIVFSPTFNPANNSEYGFNWTQASYFVAGNWVSTSPSAMGEYPVKYDIRNSDSKVGTYPVVGTREMILKIVATQVKTVRKTAGTYTESIQWGTALKYEISSQGTVSGGVSQYYYSTNYNSSNPAASTWTLINISPSSTSSCPIIYDFALPTPEPGNEGGSSAVNYTFMAVGPGGQVVNYGGVDYMFVAISTTSTYKIDTFVPSVSNVEVGQYINGEWTPYDGHPTNIAVYFKATISYGGSGAQVIALNSGKTLLYNSLLPDPNFNGTSNASVTRDREVVFSLGIEYSGNVYIQVKNGVNKTSIYQTGEPLVHCAFPINIDFTPPVISLLSSTFLPNQYGWDNKQVSFYYTVTDTGAAASGVEPSGFSCPEAVQVKPSLDGTIYNRSCEIQIRNNKNHYFSVTDKAGNVATVELQENIDVEDLILTMDEESYDPNTWGNALATIIGNVQSGPSPIKYEYKVGTGDFITWNESEGFINPIYSFAEGVYFSTNQFDIDPGETGINATYTLRISNMAGSAKTGSVNVRLDVHVPTITVDTNLSPYQGASFVTSAVLVNFRVADNVHFFNSGVKDVYVDDGSGKVLISPTVPEIPLSFQFSVTKCTLHTIYVLDEAGNEGVYPFTLKVDLGTPNIGAILYIGGGNPSNPSEIPEEGDNDQTNIYDSSDMHKYVTELDDSPWIRMEFTITATASGTVLQRSTNKTTWVSVSNTLVPEGSDTQQDFNIRMYFEQEQNISYYFRLATGGSRFTYLTSSGGSDAGPSTGYQIRIDKTPPVFNQKFIVERVEKDLTTKWTTKSATWKFLFFEDSLIGSGIKPDSTTLYSFPYTMEDSSIINEYTSGTITSGTKITLPVPAQGEYTLTLSADSLKYLLYARDNAGHETVSVVFPLIDMTQNFYISSITPAVKKLDESASENSYSSLFWIPSDEKIEFNIQTNFDTQNGRNSFGPSGGGVEFSVDGGVVWQEFISIEGVLEEVSLKESNQYLLIAKEPQYYQYKFRTFTGAGAYSTFATQYWVKKDNVSPEVSLSTIYTVDGLVYVPYDGVMWIDGIVKINMEVILGASLGSVYFATTPIDGGDLSSWEHVKTIGKDDVTYVPANEHYLYQGEIVINTTDCATYFVKIITKRDSVTPGTYIEKTSDSGVDVRVDRDAISIEGRGYKVIDGDELFSNDWSNDNFDLKAYPLSKGPSEIVEVFISTLNGVTWTEFAKIGTDINASYFVSHENYLIKQYRLKVINAAGKEGISPVYTANIDKYTPSFTMDIDTSPIGFGAYANWYVQNVSVIMQPAQHPEYGLQGYVASYYYRPHINGQEENVGWIGPVDMEEFEFLLKADNIVGGNDYDFRFTVRGRSGIEASFVTEYIPIDTTDYTYTINMSVADVLDPMSGGIPTFASSTKGTSMTYKRGTNPEVGFACATSYRIKSVKEFAGGVVTSLIQDVSFNENLLNFEKNYATGGNHIVWEVKLYRELAIDYSYITQSKQQGTIVSLGYVPQDTNFSSIFGNLTHVEVPGVGQLGLDILYSSGEGPQSSTIPQGIGVYDVEVSVRNSLKDIYVINPSVAFKIVYFSGEGTRNSPYVVGNQTDFEMISQYMYFEEGYDLEDPLACLGANRRNAYFMQSNDFTVSRDMNPICGRGLDYVSDFMGTYNGNGYLISIVDTVNVYSSYALFAYVSGTIENLSVRMTQKINYTTEPRSIGFIAAEAINGNIKNSSAIGSVTLTGEDVFFGGITGRADNSLISKCYSDVDITITSASGMVGGVVGKLYNNSFCDADYSSGFIKVISSNLYKKTLPLEGSLCVGLIAGFSSPLAEGVGPERNSLYIENNLAVDGIITTASPMANIEDFLGLKMIGITGFEMLTATEGVITTEGREETLGNLIKKTMKSKADALAVSGLGTADSPYIINSSSKFIMVERIPWAYYSQTSNIAFENTQRAYFCYDMPFTGIYDGNNFEVANIAYSLEDIKYLGLFAIIKGSVKNLKLVGVDIKISSDSVNLYVGSLSALLLDDAIVDKIVVSGDIKISSNSGQIIAGGIIGLANKATVTNCVGMASVNVISSQYSIIGGLIAQVQDQSIISNMVAISTVTNNFDISGGTGRVIASVLSGSATVSNLYAVENISYSNGKMLLGGGVAYSAAPITSCTVTSYESLAGTSSNLMIGGVPVKNIVSSLFPFEEGTGTSDNPFKISTYRELLSIGKYMFASFVLTENIIIGDLNGDGQLTGADKYTFDFVPIGNGAAFTGYLDGTSNKMVNGQMKPVKHYIVGLNQPLFEINSGRIANIGLSVDYKLYAAPSDIPETEKYEIDGEIYSPSKVAVPGKDEYFGGVARFNRSEGILRNVTIEGSIIIDAPSMQKVVVGGLVGADYGGSIVANIVDIEMDIKGFILEVGGIVGSVQSGENSLTYMDTQIVEGEIKISAATYSVGVMIGAVKVISSKATPNIIPQCDIYIDNVLLDASPIYGRRING